MRDHHLFRDPFYVRKQTLTFFFFRSFGPIRKGALLIDPQHQRKENGNCLPPKRKKKERNWIGPFCQSVSPSSRSYWPIFRIPFLGWVRYTLRTWAGRAAHVGLSSPFSFSLCLCKRMISRHPEKSRLTPWRMVPPQDDEFNFHLNLEQLLIYFYRRRWSVIQIIVYLNRN